MEKIFYLERPTKEELQNMIDKFDKNPKIYRPLSEVYRSIEKFVERFPIDSLSRLPIEDYLWYTDEPDKRDTFCYQLYRGVVNSSMARTRPDFYGIFYRNYTYHCNKTILNKSFSSIEDAYNWQLNEIIKLLDAGAKNDLEVLDANEVNSMIKCKLLSIYYPESYLPMNTRDYISNILNALNIPYKNNESAIILSERLMNWKISTPVVCDWDNYMFMSFCDQNFKLENKSGETKKAYPTPNGKPAAIPSREIRTNNCSITSGESNYIQKAFEVSDISDTERQILAKARIGQSGFRTGLLRKYNGKCVLCGMSCEELLIASHIKEWSEAEANERVDVENGLLLCALHDSLFDKHLITFDDNGKIIISNKLNQRNQMLCNVIQIPQIKLSDKSKEYMKWHRKKFETNN